MGKWHLGDELNAQHGFHEWIAIEDGYTLTGDERSPYHHWLIARGFKPDSSRNSFSRNFSNSLPIEYSKPEFLREKGIEFLEKHQDEPFILYLSFLQPHTPNFGPLDNLHRPHDVSLPPTINAPLGDDAPLRYRLMSKVRGRRSSQEWRRQIAKYWGLVTQVDRSVGAVLAKLRELGLYDNTIVVFTSEHGKQMGEHGLWRKTVMYESSSRVPWIIKAPGVQPRVVDAAVSQIHLVPTLLDLMGKSPVQSLPGRSLVPVMQGAARDYGDVFLQWNPPSSFKVPDRVAGFSPEDVKQAVGEHTRAVITQDGWKLCLSDVDRAQLFNLQKDPYESANLFYTDEYRESVKSLSEKILTWQRETADTVQLR